MQNVLITITIKYNIRKFSQYRYFNITHCREHHKAGNTGKALQYYKAALQYRNDDTTVQKAYLTLKKQQKNK